MHYLGGAYLVWLGVRALRQKPNCRRHGYRNLPQGFLVELGNPKVALLFLAFFPQFVHPDRGAAWSQVFVLGVPFCVIGLVSDSLYALRFGMLNARLRNRTRWLRRSQRMSGCFTLGLGA